MLRLLIFPSSSVWVVVAGRSMRTECNPSRAHILSLEETYATLAGLSPTRMTARPGVRLCCDLRLVTSAAVSALICSAIALPSMILAGISAASPDHVNAFDFKDGEPFAALPAFRAHDPDVLAVVTGEVYLSAVEVADA